MKNLINVFCLIVILASCDKVYYYPDRDSGYQETKFLAHRSGGNSAYQENTLLSARYGLDALHGIEVDIQLSKDRTIWLSHSANLEECGSIQLPCFPEVGDDEIIDRDSCLGIEYTYSKLEEIFRLMVDSFPGKYISLDVKSWEPCALTSLDITGVMNVIAEEIIKFADKYHLHDYIMVESETATFLNFIKKKNNRIECYLTTFGDFERGMLLALEAGYAGISFKFKFGEEITNDHIHLIRKKGLKIQLWTINDTAVIQEAFELNPDFIQTDNIEYCRDVFLK